MPFDEPPGCNSDRSIQSVFYLRERYRANSSVVGPGPLPPGWTESWLESQSITMPLQGGGSEGAGGRGGQGASGGGICWLHWLSPLASSTRSTCLPLALIRWLAGSHWLVTLPVSATGSPPGGWLSLAGCASTGSPPALSSTPQAGSQWLVALALLRLALIGWFGSDSPPALIEQPSTGLIDRIERPSTQLCANLSATRRGL